jgi:hypothetical protein
MLTVSASMPSYVLVSHIGTPIVQIMEIASSLAGHYPA